MDNLGFVKDIFQKSPLPLLLDHNSKAETGVNCSLCTVSTFYFLFSAFFLYATNFLTLHTELACFWRTHTRTVCQFGLYTSAAALMSNRCWSSSSCYCPAMSRFIVPLYIPDRTFVYIYTHTTLCNMCAFWEVAYFQVPCSSDVSLGGEKSTAHGS